MFSQGDSLAAPILGTCALIGLVFGFWFWDASHYTQGANINPSYRSYLPDYCSILVDLAGEPKKAEQVYFWQGTIRIDLKITDLDKNVTQAHEIITPGDTSYIWRDDRAVGDQLIGVRDYTMLSDVSAANAWFCFPWISFDYSKFNTPKEVTFVPKIAQ